MMLRFLAFFIFMSCAQAISTSDFQTHFASESRGLNHSNGQSQEFLERPYRSIEDKMRLDEKVKERKYEVYDASRKAQRGRGGAYGGANINHRPRRNRNSATSSLKVPHFWVSTSIPSVSLALIYVFPFH